MKSTITYNRVAPRDFFNEAKLLKCMGVLALSILDRMLPDGIEMEIGECGEPFDVRMSEDGDLFVSNYPVKVNGNEVFFKTNYNSKSNFPFYCQVDYEDTLVFDENGKFSEDFIQKFKTN